MDARFLLTFLIALLRWSINISRALPVNEELSQDGAARGGSDEWTSKGSEVRSRRRSELLLEMLDNYHFTQPTIVDRQGRFIANIPHPQQQQQQHHHHHLLRQQQQQQQLGRNSKKQLRHRRDVNETPPSEWLGHETTPPGDQLFYMLTAFDREFHLNLTLNLDLASPSLSVEFWNESGVVDRRTGSGQQRCHYVGHVVSEEMTSRAAVSNCNGGLVGLFATSDEEFLVEPFWSVTGGGEELEKGREGGDGMGGGPGEQQRLHIVYRRSSIRRKTHHPSSSTSGCGLSERHPTTSSDFRFKKKDFVWKGTRSDPANATEAPSGRRKQRTKRSVISKRSFVETLVVVDTEMVSYHGLDLVEPYVMTIMNIVARLFRVESIGHEVNIVITRIIVLNGSKPADLEISNHADRSLESFCLWQSRINSASEEALNTNRVDIIPPQHHDNAVLLTKHDICTYKNLPCGTLGLAPVAGMCEADRSCSINEDIGLATAFTVAHEIGHNFGMQHDGSGNNCGISRGQDTARIMAAQLAKNRDPFSWSKCSRDYLANFLESGKGKCLENFPYQKPLAYPKALGGKIHDGDAQCRFIHGPSSFQCKKEEEVCRELWCIDPRNQQCVTNNIPAAEGTTCTLTNRSLSTPSFPSSPSDGWCYRGLCVRADWRPLAIDGQWGEWSGWGQCSRTCGGGVESKERNCNQPRPMHGGNFCVGERLLYRSCNIHDCPPNSTDFRELQCSKFDNETFRNKFFKWKPFLGGHVRPCALNCLAVGHNFYTERSSKVVDGTRCHSDSLDICVNGDCQSVGCDRVLGSKAVDDRCGVCGGDGSTCSTVRSQVDKEMPAEASDTYVEIVNIPVGAVHIRFAETRATKNYLALKSSDGFHINGGWTIDWPRSFDVAGTVFRYERPKDRPEALVAVGPTSRELSLMVLVQESSVSVVYEFNVKTSPPPAPNKTTTSSRDYVWRHLVWSDCSVTCGKGIRQAAPMCVRVSDRVPGHDGLCSKTQLRPLNLTMSCSMNPCTAHYKAGNWSECSRTCGGGLRIRRVVCTRQISPFETEVLDPELCSSSRRPKSRLRCNEGACPSSWRVTDWSECRPQCGERIRTRKVFCVSYDNRTAADHLCDLNTRPIRQEDCSSTVCPGPRWVTGAWGECSTNCDSDGADGAGGVQMRSVACRAFNGEPSNGCELRTKPPISQMCRGQCTGSLEPIRRKDDGCTDISKVEYCPLVLRFHFCSRPYFRQLCCQTCSSAGV